jgi:hypothetical protein
MLIVFIAFQIIAMVDDEDVISRKSFDHYLISEFMPYVKSFYDVSIKAITALEEFFRLVLQAIQQMQLGKCEVIAMVVHQLSR